MSSAFFKKFSKKGEFSEKTRLFDDFDIKLQQKSAVFCYFL